MNSDFPATPKTSFNPRIIAISAVIGIIGMGLLALVIINQFRAVQIRDARDIGSAYIQGFLAPYAQEAHAAGHMSMLSQTELMRLVGDLATARRFNAIRIRAVSGQIMFASDSMEVALAENPEEFHLALEGMAVAEIHWPIRNSSRHRYPTVEIYAPIYDGATNDLIAVGEIYQDARLLLAERAQFERRVWGGFGAATLVFLAMMWLVARQQRQLMANIAHQEQISSQHAALKEAAELAWRSSSQSNEALLNQLGAELHDGPVQMLSLLALMAPSGGADPSPQGIARDVLADLRRISAGLTLPELDQLSVRETVMLAIARHRNATGTDVAQDIGAVPDSLDDQRKTCVYRIVQEGLNNAVRHGGGNGQRVHVAMAAGALHISVADMGRASNDTTPEDAKPRHTGLGVVGLRNRLMVFGGTLDIQRPPEGGFILAATLPLA